MGGNATLLILRLEGMLQSWGDHSKWDTRDSGDFPSKSGVVGLLACAMGLERGCREIAELSANIQVAVRADRPGVRMLDFHTVQGRPRLRTADNGDRTEDKSTIVSTRWYLQDASFIAVVDAPPVWRERICAALRRPAWPIYLGRKCCVPSRPVLERVTDAYDGLMDAVRRYPPLRRSDDPEQPQYYYECELPQGGVGSYSRADERVSGGRDFALRTVFRGVISGEGQHVSDKN